MVRVQPGITGAMVNAYLKKFTRKIGPDPSSIEAAMMGGILSNNASGMCCGFSLIRIILPDLFVLYSQMDKHFLLKKKVIMNVLKHRAGICHMS